jgi:hypothetical protein
MVIHKCDFCKKELNDVDIKNNESEKKFANWDELNRCKKCWLGFQCDSCDNLFIDEDGELGTTYDRDGEKDYERPEVCRDCGPKYYK